MHSRQRSDPSPPVYYYRRELNPRDLLPAVGAAVGLGLAAFIVTRVLLQRTPIHVARSAGKRDHGRSRTE